VEDYFQLSAFEKTIARGDWDKYACRVERNTNRILQLFSDYNVSATFFVLGWVAERYPTLIQKIVAQKHELASHGYAHQRATQQTQLEFQNDIVRAKKLLEDLSGQPVVGYRAPSYSVGEKNLWALEEIRNAGYLYSSSIYPIRHDLYGMPNAPRFAFHPDMATELLEVPVTTVVVNGKKYPCGGGGYFRLYPYWISRWALNKVNVDDKEAAVFYFHPWEIDVEQPRISNAPLKSRFRHYLNLNKTEYRLKRLFGDFNWGRMDRIFLQ
jgi:polysaccharide deacetylase family protein (PEP-CTERM system associated)